MVGYKHYLGGGVCDVVAMDEVNNPFVGVLVPKLVLAPCLEVCLLEPLLVPQELDLGTIEKYQGKVEPWNIV
jgi:hypothetical protein